jgi:hypothetical protein
LNENMKITRFLVFMPHSNPGKCENCRHFLPIACDLRRSIDWLSSNFDKKSIILKDEIFNVQKTENQTFEDFDIDLQLFS